MKVVRKEFLAMTADEFQNFLRVKEGLLNAEDEMDTPEFRKALRDAVRALRIVQYFVEAEND